MSSSYIARSDIEAVFGVDNVAAWATLSTGDNSGTITARIASIIIIASDDLDEVLREVAGVDARLPLTAPTPNVVYNVACHAGFLLYGPRASDDYGKDPQSYPSLLESRYQRWLAEVRDGKRRLEVS
jgi:hypothetical protein